MNFNTGVARSERKKATAQPRKAATTVALDRAVSKAADEIRAAHAEELSDRVTAERAKRLFGACLIPRRKPGPELSESVSTALLMRQSGATWQDIYPKAIPGYRLMDKYEREARTANLRRNVKRALKRREPKAAGDSPPVQIVANV